MAWRCSGASNAALVENLGRHGLVTAPSVRDALLRVDRANYAPASPYEDSPQPIGHGATISAPHMHASALEHVLPYLVHSSSASPTSDTSAGRGRRVLDIGSGSGYLTHVLAELAGCHVDEDTDDGGGLVVGLEHIRELRDLGEVNMRKSQQGKRLLDSGAVKFRVGDGRLGLDDEPPRSGQEASDTGWDVIHVGASAKEVHPQLLAQLRSPGCIFIPVDDDEDGYSQHVWLIEKDKHGTVSKTQLFGVRYVPLTDAPKKS